MSDALIEAEELLEQLPDAVSRRSLGERLSQAVHELRSADHQIQRIKALIETAEILDFGNEPHRAETLEDMVDYARMVGSALEKADDPDALRKAVYEYSNDLQRAIAGLERAIREYWRTIVNERFQPLIGLGQLLTSMNVPNDLGNRLTACGKKGLSVLNASSAPDLHVAIKTLLADEEALQAERTAEIGNDEVGDFINALADKRATLAMVTPKVREWLSDHQALDRLGITTR